MNSVCILSSVHNRSDTRIFVKQIPSLVRSGFRLSAIVADGKGDDFSNGYNLYDVGNVKNRIARMIIVPKRVYKKARKINANVYHFHDPELIPVGLKLKKLGKQVIYDVHEDVPNDILSKEWIFQPLKKVISYWFMKYEDKASRNFNHIITATPFIRDRFQKNCHSVIDINNYPLKNELFSSKKWEEKLNAICYIGNITRARGISSIIEAMSSVDGELFLAGTFDYISYRKELHKKHGWSKVHELGQVDRKTAKEIISKSIAGLAVFLPEANHVNSQPNKIFEYMSAGIPVISSNFELWKTIIEKNNCGLCVNPLDPKEIADAINYLVKNKDLAEKMGQNGINIIRDLFNWNFEEKKLIDIYNYLA
jgi:glycosyltransferase involved in cell wall biosynthesis